MGITSACPPFPWTVRRPRTTSISPHFQQPELVSAPPQPRHKLDRALAAQRRLRSNEPVHDVLRYACRSERFRGPGALIVAAGSNDTRSFSAAHRNSDRTAAVRFAFVASDESPQ